MKKLIALMLAVLMVFSLFGCGKKDDETAENPADKTEDTVKDDAVTDVPSDDEEPEDKEEDLGIDATESVDISGLYIMENGKSELMFYDDGGEWFVEGMAKDRTDGVMNLGGVSGHITGEGNEYAYDDGEGKMTFTFSQDAMSLQVKTDNESYFGCETAAFSGTYYISGNENTLLYYDVEKAGIIASAMYLAGGDYDGNTEIDNDLAVNFLLAYADICDTMPKEEFDGLEEGVKYCAFDESELDMLLYTAFSGKYGTDKLLTSSSRNDIVYNADCYYVPCTGTYEGDISFDYDYESFPANDSVLTIELSAKKNGGEISDTLQVTLNPMGGELFYTISAVKA